MKLWWMSTAFVLVLLLQGSGWADESRRSQGVLVSSSSAPQPAPAAPAPAKNTLRLRFVPKNPAPQTSAVTPASAPSVSVAASAPVPAGPDKDADVALTPDEEYVLARSRQEHPLAVRVENASPVKQVVGSPKTIDYSTARTAYVLDPGRPATSAAPGTVRMRPRNTSAES